MGTSGLRKITQEESNSTLWFFVTLLTVNTVLIGLWIIGQVCGDRGFLFRDSNTAES